MKLFKLISVIAVSAVAISATAAEQFAYPTLTEVNYSLPSHVGGGDQIYYNCDSVESSVKTILKQLGAEKISVRCTGGIDHFGPPMPAFVRTQFVAASMVKNNEMPRKAVVKAISLRDNGSCHLYSQSLDALSNAMELEVVAGPSSCRLDTRIRSKFEVNVLAFE